VVVLPAGADVMTTIELIQAEIGKIPEERLRELYGVIREFAASKPATRQPGITAKLREVRIEAPVDFAANLDLYLSGEKSVAEDIHWCGKR
jgi:hypothetical protein